MKKIIITVILVLVLAMAFSTTAFADTDNYSGSCLRNFWTTGSLNQYRDKVLADYCTSSTYNGSETWHYAQISEGKIIDACVAAGHNGHSFPIAAWYYSQRSPYENGEPMRTLYLWIDNVDHYGERIYVSGNWGVYSSVSALPSQYNPYKTIYGD